MEAKKYFLVSPGDSAKHPRPYYWSLDIGAKDLVIEVAEAHHLTQLDWRKTPFQNDELATGWLSRDGRFYGCPSVHHDVIAFCVLGIKVSDLENMGWTRVYSDRFTCEKRLSAEQRNWLSANGHKVYDSH